MSDALSAVLGAAPQLGGGGIFVVVLVLLMRREAQAVDRWETERKRLNDEHAAERDDWREQLESLNSRVDTERSRRWAVEDSRYSDAAPTGRRHRSRTEGTP